MGVRGWVRERACDVRVSVDERVRVACMQQGGRRVVFSTRGFVPTIYFASGY